jgi:succinate dehydrogenase flavin-adding protein (antitoxin of CptAB toxin-antitoxin module)
MGDEELKYVKFSSQLNEKELGKYEALLMEYQDIFAWFYKDLKGIPPKIT